MATAIGAYATLTPLKQRLGVTDVTDDALLQTICDQVNGYIESVAHRVLAPLGTQTYLFDGFYNLEGRRLLLVPRGVLTVTQVQVAAYTGAPFTTTPLGDIFLRPPVQEREPGWPATEIWFTDIPSTANQYPYFPQGFNTVSVSGTWGFAAIPDEITDLALTMAVRAWHARQTGQADIVGNDENGAPIVSRFVSNRDRLTLLRYAVKTVEIV